MISVVVPVYNVRRYLPACLDSLLQQSYPNWEALLIDDGSTDGSELICDQYAKADPRFHVFHKANGGAASAKNLGLDESGGEYITFLDSDDYLEPNAFEITVNTALEQGADVVEFQFDNVYTNRTERGSLSAEHLEISSAESYLRQYPFTWTSSLFCNKLFRKQIIGAVRFRKERRCIDDEFFTYKVVSNAEKIARIGDVLYHYRQRRSSAVKNEKNQVQITKDAIEVLIERYEWISSRFPRIREVYLQHDVDVLAYFTQLQYDEDTIRLFRTTARYYLKEAIIHFAKLQTLVCAMRIQCISNKKLLESVVLKSDGQETDDYYE